MGAHTKSTTYKNDHIEIHDEIILYEIVEPHAGIQTPLVSRDLDNCSTVLNIKQRAG